ncbi:hypothetical protein METY_0249 [Methylopila sp. Yamaguchi]|nr:hypothetical protein METY_0249 [Methylopila sp. Yamaguchi]
MALRAHQKSSKPATSKLANAQVSLVAKLRLWVDDLKLDDEIVAELLPSGKPHDYESQLWDYKEKLPCLPNKPTDEDRKLHKSEIGDIIKDVVAFHNSYGGYILFGVSDKGSSRIKNCIGDFDLGDFNRRLESYTGNSIECSFRFFEMSTQVGTARLALMLVPRRPARVAPVRFKKMGPEKPNGKRCFNEETYVRIRDECRPASATSEDWQFLHADRSPPEAPGGRNRPAVVSALPARDPDLVEFVGRTDVLASLRSWLSDPRSPVRLVTGIGGLGKTSVAYRLAEEVVASGGGEIEWVIWLTAKQRTYSALRGHLIQASRVDFGNLEELYEAILQTLSHQISPDIDEPSLDELADRVVDAFQNYTCLLIIDDIDSLAPDEQKEMVAALNGLALRTVGRDIPCSRILMTSRIDQGMPPTAVVKIAGLEYESFSRFVSNICEVFEIAGISGKNMEDLYVATSGSPLFAASVVRLVKLGENLATAIETWKGQEGEEVRRFAFQREISRLGGSQGRLLYAVLLLGETSVNDLASILEVTPKVVRDRVSDLQSYHLISTSTKESGDSVIFAPSDLSAVTELLRSHLGSQAASVEQACARAQERSNTDNRSIGAGIRRVVAGWNVGRADEALRVAQELRTKFPKSGDVANVLGQALLRQSPPRTADADREFDAARRLGCTRPELMADAINTKIELKDWQVLLDMVSSWSSNDRAHDVPLYAHIRACSELISIAKERGDYARVAELAIGAVERISKKFSRLRLEKRQFDELNSHRFGYAREYIVALDRLNPRSGDKLNVFDGIWKLAESDVALVDLVRVGIVALQAWWSDVEGRSVIDTTACHILNRQLGRLVRLERQLRDYGLTQSSVFDELARARLDLAHRGARLVA